MRFSAQTFLAVIMSLAVVLTASCVTPKPPPEPKPGPTPEVTTDFAKQANNVAGIRGIVQTESSAIKTGAGIIKADTAAGREKAPTLSNWSNIDKTADSINASSDKLLATTAQLNTVETQLNLAKQEVEKVKLSVVEKDKKIKEQDVTIATQKEDITSYQSGGKKMLQLIWAGLTGLCALGLTVSVFLFIYSKSELGLAGMATSLIVAGIAYFYTEFSIPAAICGGVIFVIMMAILVYQIAIHKTALVETVGSMEIVKPKDWNDPASTLKQRVNDFQSKTTKDLVKTVKFVEGIGK